MTTPEPPLEAERSVVGVILAHGGAILDEINLAADDFSNIDLANVFEAATRLHSAGAPVTVATIQPKVTSNMADLIELSADYQFDRYALQSHAKLIARHGVYSRLIEASKTFPEGFEGLDGPDDLMEYARKTIDQAAGRQQTRLRYVGDILPDTLEFMRSEATFIPTPWKSLNEMIGGLRPGTLVVVAARPGVGKSVVANGCALALGQHGHVAYASLEMSENEVVQRMIADQADINIGKMKDNRLTADDLSQIEQRNEWLRLPIAVDDTAGIGPAELRKFVRSVARNGKLSGVIVDYMQLMTVKSAAKRQEQVADFSRQLKLIAKEYQVPVVALAQLNRDSEGPMGRARPKMSQLRESGAIEQDADVILLLHREDDPDGRMSDTEIQFDVAKNRHGRIGFKTLAWDGSRSRISDFA